LKPYYEDSAVTIYHGKMEEIVPTLGRFELLLTDPPYLVGAKGCGLAGNRKYLQDITSTGIDSGFDDSILDGFENWAVFCGKQQIPDMLQKVGTGNWMLVTWCKSNPTPLVNSNYLPDTEYIFHKWTVGRLFGKYEDKSRFIMTTSGKSDFDHPTVKPLNVVAKFIRLGTQPGETILDPFAGSCTTGRAAKDLGRQCVCIEREERYCEIGAKRMQQEVMTFTEPVKRGMIEAELFGNEKGNQ